MTLMPPDLEIRIRVLPANSSSRLTYYLRGCGFSDHEVAGPEIKMPLQSFAEAELKTLESLHNKSDYGRDRLLLEEIPYELECLGNALYEALFTPDMRSIYRDIRERVRTILIISDEPVIPWELLKPVDDDFLCIRFQLTRWLPGPASPTSLVHVERMAFIGLAANAAQHLPMVEQERDLLTKLAQRHLGIEDISPSSATFAEVLSLLKNGSADLLHFASHGDFASESPNQSEIKLEDRRLRPIHIPDATGSGADEGRPLVFLNACRTARLGWSLTGLAGWAKAWVSRYKCGALLAPQWIVKDKLAFEFARIFYQEMEAGRTLGEAVQLARKGVKELDPRPTWLAYAVYGHPNARFHFGGEELPTDSPRLAPRNSKRRAETDWLAVVQSNAERVRKNLDPITLPRISRLDVLPALRRSIEQGHGRIVAILGAAGYGKSTLLGEIYDTLQTAGLSWIVLIDSAELEFTDGDDFETSLGRAAGSATPIPQLVGELKRTAGTGIVMIDTLDLVLHPALVPHLQRVLHSLSEMEIPVAFTCRDHDYDMVLGPRDRLKQIRERIDRFPVPPFQEQEIEQAARAFVEQRTGPAGALSGANFARKVLDLSTDSRPLRQIIESPLLLGMLCELFLDERDVPRDLTVTQLYDEYWRNKVAKSRIFDPGSAELLEKPKLCYQIAGRLLEQSVQHLQESIHEVDLDLDGAAKAGARKDLLSDGVLKSHRQDSLRFFHQTFLEFTMARWLATQAGAPVMPRILEAVGPARSRDAPLHWWPVLRQFLVMASDAAFDQISNSLEWKSPAAFRTVSLAAAVRSDRLTLLRLLELAILLGDEHQGYLCFAVESAPALDLDVAWTIVCEIIRAGRKKGCLAATQTAIVLLRTAGASLASRLREAMDAIDTRTATDRDREARIEIQGQLFQAILPLLRERISSEPDLLDLLEERFASLAQRIRADVVRVVAAASLTDERKRRFLESLLRHPAMGGIEEEILTLFLCRLRAEAAARNGRTEDKMALLQAPVSDDWQGFYAGAVGRLHGQDPRFIEAVLQDFFSSPPKTRYRDLMALKEVIQGGGSPIVRQALLAIPGESIPRTALRELGEVVRDLSAHSDSAGREAVAQWLRPLVERWPEETLSLYSAVADASEASWELLISTLDTLMAAGQTKALKRAVLAVRPEAVHRLAPQIERFAGLDSSRSIYKQLLVKRYSSSAHQPEALLRLRDLALDKEREIAVQAVHGLVAAAEKGQYPPLSALLSLLRSPLPPVRERALDVLLVIQSSKAEQISAEDLGLLAEVARHDTNPAVVERFCKLLQEEIRRRQEISRDIVEVTVDLAKGLKGKRKLGNRVGRSLLRVYKLIAQRENTAFMELLETGTRTILGAIDINFVTRGEVEVINLICALARVDRDVLLRLVERASVFEPRNVRPLAIAIHRIEGRTSLLLDQILAAEWCPPETRSLILELQGV